MPQKFYCLILILMIGCNDPDPIIIDPKEDELIGQLVSCNQSLENLNLHTCGLDKQEGQIEIWTWNLKFFPQSNTTAQSVIDIIEYYQPDAIAFQEINSISTMQNVLEAMETYNGWVVNLSGNLDVAYAYNTCSITSLAEPIPILESKVWPRPPVLWKARVGQDTLNLINIHLKCCNDGVEDRMNATLAIKEYILNELLDQPTILLGDFNDEIDDEGILDFYADSSQFRYADESISFGEDIYWSYPGWPSDIDHILINQPPFDQVDTAATLLFDQCITNYAQTISDHRAVSAILNSK